MEGASIGGAGCLEELAASSHQPRAISLEPASRLPRAGCQEPRGRPTERGHTDLCTSCGTRRLSE
eukprot:scaffold99043_cov36-Phaeocystis_antarctica.AAC.1